MSWRGFGSEWNEVLVGLAALALVLVLILLGQWLALALVAGLALGAIAVIRL